ncbi:hypothetical protein BH10PLA2_BH10PLA2_34120 [soil metagenome]
MSDLLNVTMDSGRHFEMSHRIRSIELRMSNGQRRNSILIIAHFLVVQLSEALQARGFTVTTSKRQPGQLSPREN